MNIDWYKNDRTPKIDVRGDDYNYFYLKNKNIQIKLYQDDYFAQVVLIGFGHMVVAYEYKSGDLVKDFIKVKSAALKYFNSVLSTGEFSRAF